MSICLFDEWERHFHEFLLRHGEAALQDLIERIERYEGILANGGVPLPLKDRWNLLMQAEAA